MHQGSPETDDGHQRQPLAVQSPSCVPISPQSRLLEQLQEVHSPPGLPVVVVGYVGEGLTGSKKNFEKKNGWSKI
jgi:hypothetical protein